MRKLLSLTIMLLAFSSICFAVAPVTDISTSEYESVFRTNEYDGTSRGKYINTVAPNFGLMPMIAKDKPLTANVQTSSIVLYFDDTKSAVEIRYIAKDVSDNVTAGTLF